MMSTKTRVEFNKDSLHKWEWDLGGNARVKKIAKEISRLYAKLITRALTEKDGCFVHETDLVDIIKKAGNVIAVSAAGSVFDQIQGDAATPILHLGSSPEAHIDIIGDGDLVLTFDFDEMVLEAAEDAIANTCEEWDGVGDVREFAAHLRSLADRLDGMASG